MDVPSVRATPNRACRWRARGDAGSWRPGQPAAVQGQWSTRFATRDGPQGIDLRPTGGSSRHPPLRFQSRSAGSATGTTATAGCATQRSPCRALNIGGITKRHALWRDWLLRVTAGDPDQLQYVRVTGESHLVEEELAWLPGYRARSRSHRQRRGRPVPARRLRQVLDALHLGRVMGMELRARGMGPSASPRPVRHRQWRNRMTGIWKVSGPRQHFTHSKVMAWVALDRSRAIERFGREGPLDEWRQVRSKSTMTYSRTVSTRAQHLRPGLRPKGLDASLLLIPLVTLPAGNGSAHARHHRRDQEGADAGRIRFALPDQ